MIKEKNQRICQVCGKIFYRRGKRIAICCSMECKHKYISKIQIGHKRIERRGIYKNCEVCGKKKYISPGKVSALGRLYCSVACRNSDPRFYDHVRGEKNHRWKGGRVKIGEYVYIKSRNHPFAHTKGGYVAEHRLIMEKHLQRYLDKNEEVHHKNKNKVDNRIGNLELVIKSAHWGQIKCPHCQQQFKIK